MTLPFLTYSQTRLVTPNELKEDINYLQEMLYAIHPSPFRYTPKKDMDALFASLLIKSEKNMEVKTFEQEINFLLTKIGCIHTTARRKIPKKSQSDTTVVKFIPFEFFNRNDNLWLGNSLKDTLKQYEWQQVLSIDGDTSEEVIKKLMGYHASDGYNSTFMERLLNRGANFTALYRSYYGQMDDTPLVLKTEEGDTLKAVIPNLSLKKKKGEKKKVNPKKEKWDKEVKNHFFRDEGDWAVLKISSFNPYKHKTRKFYREIFKHLDEKGTQTLVIDLRDNLGGSISDANNVLKKILDEDFVVLLERKKAPTFKYSSFTSKISYVFFSMNRLMSFRKNYKKGDTKVTELKMKVSRKHNFEGTVYVITNGYSASSSSYLATFLKHKENAIIVGDESGGGAAGNNGLYYTMVKLPNSNLQVRVPFYWLDYQLKEDEGRGVMPDKEILYSIEDLKNKKDLEMEWLKGQLNK